MNNEVEVPRVIIGVIVIWLICQYFSLILANFILINWLKLPITIQFFGQFDLLLHYWNEYNHIKKIKTAVLTCFGVAVGLPLLVALGMLLAVFMPRQQSLHFLSCLLGSELRYEKITEPANFLSCLLGSEQ